MNAETFFKHFATFAEAIDGIERIKTLIYELAFTGRLGADSDGVDNVELTSGWIERDVGEVVEFARPGFACSKTHQVIDGHVHLRTHNISTESRLNFDLMIRIDRSMVDPNRASLRKGDILFNNTNSQELVGKTCLVDQDYDYGFSNHLTQIRLLDGFEPDFFVRQINLLWRRGDFAKQCNRWIGQAGINTKALMAMRLRFPPLAEQKRIVAKLDRLLGLCDELESRQAARREARMRLVGATLDRLVSTSSTAEFPKHVNRVRDQFDRLFDTLTTIPQLRQTILQLAVQGKLVPQDPNDEPAESIFKRVGEDRRNNIKQNTAEATERLEAVKEDEEPFQLPPSWRWVRLGDVASIKHGFAFSSNSFSNEPTKFVLTTPGNFHETGGFRDRGQKTKYYDGPVPPGFVLKSGDLIVPMTEQAAGLLGSPAFVPNDGKSYLHNQRLGKLSFYSESIAPEFVFWFFNCEFFRDELARNCTGMKVRHTSPKKILKVPFPLCSLTEQRRIVEKVEQMMSFCDDLETKLTESETLSTQLLSAAVHHLLNASSTKQLGK